MEKSKVAKGRAAVLLFALKLMEHGVQVFEPLHEDTPIDLVAYTGHAFYRVQVKSAHAVKSSVGGSFEIPFRKITIGAGHVCKVKKYTREHIDYLVGVLPKTGDFYCFPVDAVDKMKSSIRVNPAGLPSKAPHCNRILDPEKYRNVITFGDEVLQL